MLRASPEGTLTRRQNCRSVRPLGLVIGHHACLLDLDVFRGLVSESSHGWTLLGAQVSVHASPDDGRPKAAAWVRIDMGARGGQLIVWDSGEGDLEFLLADGTVHMKHYDELTDATVRVAFNDLTGLIEDAAP